MLHVLARLGTDLHMYDTAFLAKQLDFLYIDFALIGYVTLVAQDDESDVGYGVLFDLLGRGGTSFSQ